MVEERRPWPEEIRLSRDRKTLTIRFDDGRAFPLAAEYLRVLSPSAEVQGHSPEQRVTVGGTVIPGSGVTNAGIADPWIIDRVASTDESQRSIPGP